MAGIEIYTKDYCPYSHAAKHELAGRGVSFREYDVTRDPAGFEAMAARSGGRRTVPQIFVDGAHVGGFDDLALLEAEGRLAPLLERFRTSAAA